MEITFPLYLEQCNVHPIARKEFEKILDSLPQDERRIIKDSNRTRQSDELEACVEFPKYNIDLLTLWYCAEYQHYIQSTDLFERFPTSKTNILDIGCNDGLITCFLALRNQRSRFRGIDWAPTAIKKAKQRLIKLSLSNAKFVCDDAFNPTRELLESLGTFDGVILRSVLGDVVNVKDCLNRLFTVTKYLKPSGEAAVLIYPERIDEDTNRVLSKVAFQAGFRISGTIPWRIIKIAHEKPAVFFTLQKP